MKPVLAVTVEIYSADEIIRAPPMQETQCKVYQGSETAGQVNVAESKGSHQK